MPYSPERAERAVNFFERVLVHTKGQWAGQPFKLAEWQREHIIKPLFGTVTERGQRQYRTAYVEIPRKNGKSEIAAGIALYMLFADGEQGAEIYGAAGDRDQASIVFNVAAEMVRRSPVLSKRAKLLDSVKRIVVPQGGSFYRAIPADAAGSHGFNASAVVFDELHVQPNRDLWDVLSTSTGARSQPLIFAITTAGYDRNSICWEQHDYALKVQNGVINDPTFFAYVRSAEESEDWTDEAVWRKANPALGEFRNVDEMRALCAKARETPALENTFRRLYLNQWTKQETRWLPLERWDACGVEVDAEALSGKMCFGGLDLSTTTDLSAFVLVFPDDDGGYDILPHFWMPAENMAERERRDRVPYSLWERQGLITATPGNVIDYDYIEQRVTDLAGRYDIREVAYDPWNAMQLVLWLQDKGLTMVPVRQGFASLSNPTKELEKLVLGSKIRHGGNPVLRWMADSVTIASDPAGNIKPVKPDRAKSANRIDGIVATIMGLDRAMRTGGPSTYESKDLLLL